MPDLHATWRPRHNPWLVGLTVTLATFMEVLDTSIANVALPHIAGGLSASQEEATWVLTSYLVSNAVVLPISAWIASRVGRKRFYMTCVLLFTISSFLCGFAPNLGSLIFFRVLQGIGGGGLAPSEQAILADTFEPRQRGMGFAMYGLAVVFAPAIGPTLGGYIVDHTSWRWIFYINVPVGIVSMFLTAMMVEDPPWLEEEKKQSRNVTVDWLGLGLVAVAFGSLQVILDKGQQDDWFASPFIVVFTLAMVIAMASMVVWEWVHPNPVVNFRLFKNRNFAASATLMFTLGATLYGTTVLIPQFAQTLMGYNAERAGLLLSPGALVTMAMMPLVGFLVSRVPAKFLIALGFGMLSLALWRMTTLNLNLDPKHLTLFRVYQASALAFLFVPINIVAYIGISREQNNQVSGLMNLARNRGQRGDCLRGDHPRPPLADLPEPAGRPAERVQPHPAREAAGDAAWALSRRSGRGPEPRLRQRLRHGAAAGGGAFLRADHRDPRGHHRDLRAADPPAGEAEQAGRRSGRGALSAAAARSYVLRGPSEVDRSVAPSAAPENGGRRGARCRSARRPRIPPGRRA